MMIEGSLKNTSQALFPGSLVAVLSPLSAFNQQRAWEHDQDGTMGNMESNTHLCCSESWQA
jgi:hypothetical protein